MALLQKVYNKLPYFLQSYAFDRYCYSLNKKRVGHENFQKGLQELLYIDQLSHEELRALQDEKLSILIRHAYETVPYYHKLMKSLKLRPNDIKKVNDLEKLPVLTKEIIKNNPEDFISNRFEKKGLIAQVTSGTTGTPLRVYSDFDAWFKNNLYDWKQKLWAGINIGDPGAVLLGREIVSPQKTKPPYWQLNKYDNVLWLSSFHLSESYIDDLMLKLMDFNPLYIEGYPSTLYSLSQLKEGSITPANLRYSFTSSEPLFEYMRESIQANLGTENFDFYGLAERVVWATECKCHTGKHIHMDYSIVELVNEDDGLIQGVDSTGYLVGTSLFNFAMPLIRYKTSDITSLIRSRCSCGVDTPRMSGISTKAEDMIMTPDGRRISPSVLTHPFKNLNSIAKSQIIQLRDDYIQVKIVSANPLNKKEENELVSGLKNRLGNKMDIEIMYVNDIPRGRNGKYRWVVSKL